MADDLPEREPAQRGLDGRRNAAGSPSWCGQDGACAVYPRSPATCSHGCQLRPFMYIPWTNTTAVESIMARDRSASVHVIASKICQPRPMRTRGRQAPASSRE